MASASASDVAARRVVAPAVADPRDDPGLVVGDPVADAVAEALETASTYSANASTVSRDGQPPASSITCGVSQWKSVTKGAIPLPSSSSTSRS